LTLVSGIHFLEKSNLTFEIAFVGKEISPVFIDKAEPFCEVREGEGTDSYLTFGSLILNLFTSAMPIQNTETAFDCAASTSLICSFSCPRTAM